jgi:NodT family efflux transporter outer membrane factor (OMF) lipoprotein
MRKPIQRKAPVFVRLVTLGICMLLVGGCMAVGPDYVQPPRSLPERWHAAADEAGTGPADPGDLSRWWRTFDDPVLELLIERAVNDNRDVKQARARLREARAQRGIAQAALFPTMDASAAARQTGMRPSGGPSSRTDLYTADFDAGWELDLFGGTRRAVEAAQADLEAEQESLNDVLVSLMAEVALNYVETRISQARLEVARSNLASQEETYLITRARYEAGLIGELPVQQSLYNLSSTRAGIPILETNLDAGQNRLAVLLGRTPGQLHPELAARRPLPTVPASVAVGIPADLLPRRPDVRQAERRLAAQTARIGAATADLYPRIRLTGSIGLEARSLGNLIDSGTLGWGVGPGISWPIFDAGAIRANIAVQNARQEQLLHQYEVLVLEAVEEVENSLTAFAKEQVRRAALVTALQAAQNAARLAQDQFKAGLVAFNDVLEAQRAVLSFEDQLVQSDGGIVSQLIRIYKSLGGGWNSLAEDHPQQSE